MECLATFVVAVLLPLSVVALVVALRAGRSARLAREDAREATTLARSLLVQRRAQGEPAAEPSSMVAPSSLLGQGDDRAAEVTSASPATAPCSPASSAGTVPPIPAVAAALAGAETGEAAGALGPVAEEAPPAVGPRPGGGPVPPRPRRRGPSLEEQLGARLPVWVGAIALVLAAAFLVKYSVDQGWIGPTVRITLGLLFGVALLGGGELLRRPAERIAQALSAAGIAVLFVVFWAAVHLYHLIGPGTGFAMLALTTATAVVLALRQGLIVALLGLVGGFVTPALVSTDHPDARLLFAYLTLLQAGLLAVSRKRGWSAIAGLTVVGALGWALLWAVGDHAAADAAWVGAFLLLSLAAALVGTRGGMSWSGTTPWLRGAAAGGALAVALVLVGATGFGLLEWGFVGLLATACLVLARLQESLHGLAWISAAAVCVLALIWANELAAGDGERFLGVLGAALVLLAGLSWGLQSGASQPARFAALAAAVSIALDLIAYAGSQHAALAVPWGGIELALAAVWIVLALPAARRRASVAGGDAVLAAAAAAATTMVSLAVPMELDRQWIGVAWALEAAALVWLAARLRVTLLAHLSAALTALVGARLLFNPAVIRYPLGTHPLVSWLLYGYVVPIAALAAAAALARRDGRGRLAVADAGVAVALAFVFLALAVRQAFHPGKLDADVLVLAEWGCLTIAWLALACGLLFAARSRTLPELRWGGAIITSAALVQALLAQGLIANPLWAHLAIGPTPVFNALLLAYGVPAVLLVVAAGAQSRLAGEQALPGVPLPRLWSIAALVLLFLLVTLEVRQAFAGNYLDRGGWHHAENYSYSAAWVVLATALLVAGVAGHRRGLRLASLPVMLLAVGKVFLYDTAHLGDLYRVFSFLGLGASLLLLAWVYQRFVFRAPPEPQGS